MPLRMLSRLLVIPVFFAGLIASAATYASQVPAEWTEPFLPHRIIVNVYYVGSRDSPPF
jgi:hypothetical protein